MRLFLVLFVLLFSLYSHSQSFKINSFFSETEQNGIIKGVILDEENDNEPLGFAEIIVKNTVHKATSKIDGSFQFNLKPGTYNLEVLFIGYQTVEIKNVEVTSNATVNIQKSIPTLKVAPSISIVSLL